MADQKIKTFYKTNHPEAKQTSEEAEMNEHHETRRAQNREIRDTHQTRSKRGLVDSAADIFSDENIIATGKHIASKIPGAIRNVGDHVSELSRAPASAPTSPRKSQKGGGYPVIPALALSPSWTRGSPIPGQFLRVPFVSTAKPPKQTKKRKTQSVPASTRPEWIRF